jgi:hypothetical protein
MSSSLWIKKGLGKRKEKKREKKKKGKKREEGKKKGLFYYALVIVTQIRCAHSEPQHRVGGLSPDRLGDTKQDAPLLQIQREQNFVGYISREQFQHCVLNPHPYSPVLL